METLQSNVSTESLVHCRDVAATSRRLAYSTFLRGLSASDVSITGAGPEMPPSFLTRQKWTIIRTEATIGMPMQCQM